MSKITSSSNHKSSQESFNSISLLLYHAIQLKLLSRPHSEYLNSARILLEALQFCAQVDTIAERYVRVFQPHFNSFVAVDGPVGEGTERVKETLQELLKILRMPFYGAQDMQTLRKISGGSDGWTHPRQDAEMN